MIYGSVCSGIESATVAWHGLEGWTPAFFSEIEPFPKAVLAHRWPGVPDLGDFTKIGAEHGPVDLLVGGTPCQSFSVAGLRGGMADARGNLALEFLRLAARLHARWVLWENVPGVLSSNGGRDFGALLGGLAELGYGFAYRVLDAQFFGVAQRRRRVFVVGHAGGQWQRAAAVLFERASLRGDPPPRREKGARAPRRAQVRADGNFAPVAFPANFSNQGMEEGLSPTLAAEQFDRNGALISLDLHNGIAGEDLSCTLGTEAARGNRGPAVAAPIPFDSTQITSAANRSAPAPGDPSHPLAAAAHAPAIAFSVKDYGADAGELAPTLRSGNHDKSHANGGVMPAIAFHVTQDPISGEVAPAMGCGNALGCGTLGVAVEAYQCHGSNVGPMGTVRAGNGNSSGGVPFVPASMAVRRLTPRECERLQGFPDDYTAIPGAKDGPRYRALGNSMAVPVMAWIGRRIQMVEDAIRAEQEAA